MNTGLTGWVLSRTTSTETAGVLYVDRVNVGLPLQVLRARNLKLSTVDTDPFESVPCSWAKQGFLKSKIIFTALSVSASRLRRAAPERRSLRFLSMCCDVVRVKWGALICAERRERERRERERERKEQGSEDASMVDPGADDACGWRWVNFAVCWLGFAAPPKGAWCDCACDCDQKYNHFNWATFHNVADARPMYKVLNGLASVAPIQFVGQTECREHLTRVSLSGANSSV